MATYVFKAMDLTGSKTEGVVEAESKQIVTDQLKSRGLIVTDIAEKGGSKEINLKLGGNKVKAEEMTIMTRQLSTMVSSGMTILRALYVLESQTESKPLTAALVAGPQGRRGRPAALRRHGAPPQGLHAASTSRWSAPARPAACSRSRCCASPTSSRRTTSCAARSSRP